MGDEMQTYRDANLHPVWADALEGPDRRGGVSAPWVVILVALVLFWAGAAAAVVALV
jgi:hypothetical protein